MVARNCPYDGTPLSQAAQKINPIKIHSLWTSSIGALFGSGARPEPWVCAECGWVGFFLEPDQVVDVLER